MIRRRRRIAALLAVALVGVPTAVWAHARLTKSDPAAKSQVTVAPSQIRLWFSEAPEVALTRIVLTDSTGNRVELGPVEPDSTRLAVHAQIRRSLPAGRYTVMWRTAAADGHPADGAFPFTVMRGAESIVTATTSAGDTTRAGSQTADTSDRLHRAGGAASASLESSGALAIVPVAVRAMGFASLLLLIGSIVFRVAIAARAPVAESMRDEMQTRAARVGVWSAGVLLVSAFARFALQVQMMSDNVGGADAMRAIALHTHWGAAWLLQVVAVTVAMLFLAAARRGSKQAWTLAAIAVLVTAVTPALGGHAAAGSRFTIVAIATDAIHVVAASAWLGTLMYVVTVAVPAATREEDDSRWRFVASVVNLYSPVALTAGATVAATGIVSAWLRLGNASALLTSAYGRTLLIKLGLLVGVAATGAYNWLRVRPSLGTAVATMRLRRSASVELAIGVLVLVVTAVLVAVPIPIPLGAG